MKKFLSAWVLIFTCGAGYTDSIPENSQAILPPPPMAPKDDNQPLTGNDAQTQTGHTNRMDTITTQSTGTSGNYQPESHPIPLEKTPPE